jgi:hypothetical protein
MPVGRCLAESPKVYSQNKLSYALNAKVIWKGKDSMSVNTSVSIFLCSENFTLPFLPPLSIVLQESESKKSSLTYTAFSGTREMVNQHPTY